MNSLRFGMRGWQTYGRFFERALSQLNIPVLSKQEAVWILLRHYIGDLAAQRTYGRDGLLPIIEVYYGADLYAQSRVYTGDSHDIHPLIGAYYRYDETDDSISVDAAVLHAARSWMQLHGTPSDKIE